MGSRFNFSGFLDVLAMILHLAVASMILTASYAKTYAIAAPEFISIDCGRSGEPYNDNGTNLAWESDEKYTSAGRNANVNITPDAYAYFGLGYYPNLKALQTLRYFPEHHNKHCYVLPTPPKNISVLIRAMFYLGPDGSISSSPLNDTLKLPINFEVAINATIWFSVSYDGQYFTGSPLIFEGILYSPGGPINVCLIPKTGVPFISSLELRPLDEEGLMYPSENSKKKLLVTKSRINFSNETSLIRFPYDKFDRLWGGVLNGLYGDYVYADPYSILPKATEGSSGPRGMPGAKFNYVPSRVMQDAFYSNSTMDFSLNSSFSYKSSLFLTEDNPLINSAYVILYFQDVQSISAPSKTLSMSVNFIDQEKRNFSVTDSVTMQSFQTLLLESNQLSFFLSTPTEPTAFPFINAMEVYEEEFINPTATDPTSEYGVMLLQKIFKLNDVGDPCSPVPFDWLQCLYQADNAFVSSVILSNLGPAHDGHLGTLRSDLLAYDSSDFPLIYTQSRLSVTHANVGDDVFHFLILVLVSSYLPAILDFSHNNIQTFPTRDALGLSEPYVIQMDTVDLSHNVLTGEIPSFLLEFQGDNFPSLRSLNLSYNNLSSLPVSWKNATTLYLEVVNFSNNVISSNISLLNELIQGNNATLRHLDFSHNKLKGPFPSLVYFSIPNLEVAKFDGNQIDGMLDLTEWYKSLEEGEKSQKESPTHFNLTLRQRVLFSFVNNSISDITPNAEAIYSTVDFVLKNINTSSSFKNSGILLGGNPYCNTAKSHAQRYLCRNSLEDVVLDPKSVSKTIKIFGSLGGTAAFLVCCAVVATILRLKRKILGLQNIQQALADQEVIPLFYSLSDIKAATRRFHSDNLLGRGAFGVVYKGILADKSSFAVKKLFKSDADQIQVLKDFLNEVVLISGIRHKNLVHLKGCCVENQERILVYEYVQNGNVAEALWGSQIHNILDWETRLKICVGTAQGLLYLHEHLQPRIVHRDIKPANILLDEDFNPKIADFGLARSFPDDASQAQTAHHGGTWGYLAPDHEITEKVDVYSFGIVVLEIVSGRKIIESDNFPPEEKYLRTWAQKLYKEGNLVELLQPELRQNWAEIESDVIRVTNVALLCVDLEPNKRPTMSQAVTMLIGSTDTPTPSVDSASILDFHSFFHNDHSRSTPTFKTLSNKFSKLNPSSKGRTADKQIRVEEESLLGSHSGSNSNRSNSINVVELSVLSGR